MKRRGGDLDGMLRAGLTAMALGLLLTGAATGVCAQTLDLGSTTRLTEDTQVLQVAQAVIPSDVPTVGPTFIPQPHRTLELDSKGRWGVRLDMEQPAGRSPSWQDVQAGAYVSLTPRVRVGGSVGFGDKFDTPQRITPQDAAAPRVRLETQFKF